MEVSVMVLEILLMCSCTTCSYDFDELRNFCTPQEFFREHCRSYNELMTGGFRSRFKRAITEECCYRKCSARFLLCNYCQDPNLDCLKKTTTESSLLNAISKDPTKLSSNFETNTLSNSVMKDTFNDISTTRRTRYGKRPPAEIGTVEDDAVPFYVRNKILYSSEEDR